MITEFQDGFITKTKLNELVGGINALQYNPNFIGKVTFKDDNGIICSEINLSENNAALGTYALKYNTSGTRNVAIGEYSLNSNSSGSFNTSIGYGNMKNNFGGYSNTSIGSDGLRSNTSGTQNVSVGEDSLGRNTIGGSNTGIGYLSLYNNIDYNNCAGLGYNSQVTGSNQVQLGDSSTITYVYGTVQNRSDLRDKSDIKDTSLGLNFINSLRPVEYKWDMREDYLSKDMNGDLSKIIKDGSKVRNRVHQGFIAQEVKYIIDKTGIDFGGFQDHSISGGQDVMSLGYDEFIAPLVKSVQELSEMVKLLQNEIKILKVK